ncbi:MAG TPA: GC-type dockerin domain-anchored protein [Phycisphaerales bacterium]|nr:GC-type dockerin domain-anchored protein [Phycisphaerales bacterium]
MVRTIATGVVGAASLAAGQTSQLYISQLDSARMVVVQGGEVVRSWDTLAAGENAVAVGDDSIRTAGNHWVGDGAGAEYDLSGNHLGPIYSIIGGGNWFDGATDGRHYNYAVQHNGDSNLYRFDRDWSNPHALFHLGNAASGVTLDVRDGTFWVTDSLTRLVRNVGRDGAVISAFPADDGQSAYGIAMDPEDGTLWVGGDQSNVIYQYDTSGALLSSVAVPGISSAFGMEFHAVMRCWADFDDNGVLDTRDVLAFLNAWVRGDGAADCDGNGVHNTIDVLCFFDMYNFGC